MKLSERILAAKGPIYKERRERWAADAKKLEDAIMGGYSYSPNVVHSTHASTVESHIAKKMRLDE